MSQPQPSHEPSPTARQPWPPRLAIAEAEHPLRSELEAFVESRFESAFGARVGRHYPTLVGLLGADGRVTAAAGVRFAEDEALFLEVYLDEVVEQAIATVHGRPVARETVAEIGSFAAVSVKEALDLFAGLSRWLSEDCGRRYAVATARPELRRLLDHAGFFLSLLGEADPERLGEDARQWGTYYEQRPRVLVGEIGGSSLLPDLCQRLRARAIARAASRMAESAQ